MTAATGSAPSFRPDIEGMRALSIVLVVAYHAGFPWLTGGFIGVDVFFVISGFLITGLLLRDADRHGRVSLRDFYARRAKRLLPAATVVLGATAVATYLWAPVTQRAVFGGDIVTAGAYLANWRFAARSVDYLAEDLGVSPVLHFWSLAVEEQFYFVWPLLIIAALAGARRLRVSVRLLAGIGLGAVALGSLWWTFGTDTGQSPEAFFITPTRMWELAAGAGLAVVAHRLPAISTRLATALAVLGAGAIVASALIIDASTPWPSAWTLLPVLGGVALIAAGTMHPSSVVARALSLKPMVWIGGISYAWYLWHWPILVIGQDWRGLTGTRWTVVLIAVSVIAAWASTRFLEHPIRSSRTMAAQPHFALSVGAGLTVTSILAGMSVIAFAPRDSSANDAVEVAVVDGQVMLDPPDLGAQSLITPDGTVLPPPSLDSYGAISPRPLSANSDRPDYDCAAEIRDMEPTLCHIGVPGADFEVVVTGDSKAFQYVDALDHAFTALGWSGTLATKSGCAFADANIRLDGQPYRNCEEFNNTLMAILENDPPDLIITGQRNPNAYGDDPYGEEVPEHMIDGLVSRWNEVLGWGTQVVVLVDNPSPPNNPSRYECLAMNVNSATECAFSREEGYLDSGAPTQLAALEQVPAAQAIDLTDFLCSEDTCPVVIGNVLVYRQGSHLTNTYALTLAPILTERLREISEQWSASD